MLGTIRKSLAYFISDTSHNWILLYYLLEFGIGKIFEKSRSTNGTPPSEPNSIKDGKCHRDTKR